ncbi:metallophosphoesterase [Paenibacillus lautus]|uniref:metallophosphoesterase family protein n=1 Tax=Paenibacillus lautus TaxID=1401 RepID=UPI002DBAF331|nr:metallophosphoesterase [Paenibacillus lautus]MEC0204697.1 metallophosphoesterase [Paenibacillus lautus]
MLDYANELSADCIILTGDIVNGATVNNLDYLEERLNSLRSSYLYTPGNHDWEYPGEPWGEGTRQAQYAKFNRYAEGNPAYQSKTTEAFC